MTLNKQCSCCKTVLTTKNTYRIANHTNKMKQRTELGLWINCKQCESTMLFLNKDTKTMLQTEKGV